MKKSIILSMLMLMGVTGVQAQEPEYVPLVREGVKWVYAFLTHPNPSDNCGAWVETFYTLEFKGETTINGVEYKNLVFDLYNRMSEPQHGTLAYMRETDKRVYAIINSEFNSHDLFMSKGYPRIENVGGAEGELVIYDFNDLKQFYDDNGGGIMTEAQDTVINGTTRKYYASKSNPKLKIIEGIGEDMVGNFLFPFCMTWPNCQTTRTMGLCYVMDAEGNVEYYGYQFPSLQDYLIITGVTAVRKDEDSQSSIYYNLLGEPVSTTKPTTPGIYIKGCKKIVIK